MIGVPGSGRHGKAALCAPLLTIALLAGLTGCTGTDGEDGGPGAAAPGKSADGSGSSSTPRGKEKQDGSPAESAPSSEPGPSSELPEAADGTDTGACADGRCEVELSKGDEVRPRSSYGIDRFTVQNVEDHVITWTALFSGGRVSMSAQGAEVSSTNCTNGACSGRMGRSKGKIEMNRLVVEFTAIGEDRAVAKISARE